MKSITVDRAMEEAMSIAWLGQKDKNPPQINAN
jgi:hypothetical protein